MRFRWLYLECEPVCFAIVVSRLCKAMLTRGQATNSGGEASPSATTSSSLAGGEAINGVHASTPAHDRAPTTQVGFVPSTPFEEYVVKTLENLQFGLEKKIEKVEEKQSQVR